MFTSHIDKKIFLTFFLTSLSLRNGKLYNIYINKIVLIKDNYIWIKMFFLHYILDTTYNIVYERLYHILYFIILWW